MPSRQRNRKTKQQREREREREGERKRERERRACGGRVCSVTMLHLGLPPQTHGLVSVTFPAPGRPTVFLHVYSWYFYLIPLNFVIALFHYCIMIRVYSNRDDQIRFILSMFYITYILYHTFIFYIFYCMLHIIFHSTNHNITIICSSVHADAAHLHSSSSLSTSSSLLPPPHLLTYADVCFAAHKRVLRSVLSRMRTAWLWWCIPNSSNI